MYCTSILVRSTHSAKKTPMLFWNIVRANSEGYFPSLDLIKLTLHSSAEIIEWSKKKHPMYQQFQLSEEEPIMAEEDAEKMPHIFWLRGIRSQGTAQLPMHIQLVYDEGQDLWRSIMIQFGKRGSTAYAAQLIGLLRDEANNLGINYDNLDIVITGYNERARNMFIRETNLVTFVPGIHHYPVHKNEKDLIDRAQFPLR